MYERMWNRLFATVLDELAGTTDQRKNYIMDFLIEMSSVETQVRSEELKRQRDIEDASINAIIVEKGLVDHKKITEKKVNRYE